MHKGSSTPNPPIAISFGPAGISNMVYSNIASAVYRKVYRAVHPNPPIAIRGGGPDGGIKGIIH